MSEYKIIIGDWSQDGHSQSDVHRFKTNRTATEIRDAYFDTCKLTGVALHRWTHPDIDYNCFVDYEDNRICSEAVHILICHGLPVDDHDHESEEGDVNMFEDTLDESGDLYVSPDEAFELFMWYVQQADPDMTWVEAPDVESINGMWNKDFNGSIGYGLFC